MILVPEGQGFVISERRIGVELRMENKDVSFKYTYSAKEQEEIKRIRQKYQVDEQDEMNKLRKLDAKVTQKATSVSLVLGVAGALALGIGMSLTMTDFGEMIGITGNVEMVLGIIVGLLGIILITLAYPVYNKVQKKERKKIAPEILKLTEELMK